MNFETLKELFANLRGLNVIWTLIFVLLAAMAIDYLSGSLAALKAGEWTSKVAREGLWHKSGTVLIIAIHALADCLFFLMSTMGLVQLPIDFSLPFTALALVWYTATEVGSSLENAVKLTGKAPRWLVKALKIAADAVDDAGDHLVDGGGNAGRAIEKKGDITDGKQP